MEIEVSEEAGVRYLHFGSDWIQGAMRIARPWSLELDYTREMMTCLLLRPEQRWPRRALLVGLGAASLTKFLHRHRPNARITVVEIESRVIAVARQHFKLPEQSTHLDIVIADAVDFMMQHGPRYDLILVDGFDADARAGMLDTLPFYVNCRARLTDDGMLITNLLSRRKDFRHSVARIKQAFDDRAFAFPSCDNGNAIAVAVTGEQLELTMEDLKKAAVKLKKHTGLNLLPTVVRLEQSTTCAGGVLSI